MFYKNGHNYQKDYGIEARTLGHQIMSWWAEICLAGVLGVQFGGPTGICTLAVLMSWWCVRLKEKLDEECTDCLRILKDIDKVLLMAIDNIKSHPATSTLTLPSTAPPPSQPRKRVNSEHMSPRKRTRSSRV